MYRIITLVATEATAVDLRRSLIGIKGVETSEIMDWNGVGFPLDAPFTPWRVDERLVMLSAKFDDMARKVMIRHLTSARRTAPVKQELLLIDPVTVREIGRLKAGATADDVARLLARAPQPEGGRMGALSVDEDMPAYVRRERGMDAGAESGPTPFPPGASTLAEGVGAVTLSPESPPSMPHNGSARQPASVVTSPQSYINVTMWDRENHAVGEQLQVDETYTLALNIDVQIDPTSLASTPLRYPWADDEQEVTLTVQLASEDFHIYTAPQALYFTRDGRSKNTARFDLRPKQVGVGVLTAILLKDGNFVQLLTIKLRVTTADASATTGGSAMAAPATTLVRVDVAGRSLASAGPLRHRDLTLTILEPDGGDGGFRLIVSGAVFASATLPLTVAQLASLVEQARAALKATVELCHGSDGSKVYQTGIDIPAEAASVALGQLARAGSLLYQHLFYGPDADEQCSLIGDTLRDIALTKETHRFVICSTRFLVPWGLLYVGALPDPDHPEQIDPELFLGLNHIIESIPCQPDLAQVDTLSIGSEPALTVSLNVNDDIDVDMGSPLVADQLRYWNEIVRVGSAHVVVRRTRDDVRSAISGGGNADQIAYFYCHATTRSLDDPGGPDTSCLVFSHGERLTLSDLYLALPHGKRLSSAPLLFFNACESAELSPLFYDGFVPFLVARGARGAIGTECATPALFAREWAARFFDHFLAGEPVGQALLDLRREFYYQHNNALGLLYALYCDADTRIDPALRLPPRIPTPAISTSP